MDTLSDQVKEKIARYIRALIAEQIVPKHVIVFGSQVHGNVDAWSDIDIAVVSDRFTGDRFTDKNLIRRITLRIGSDIDVIPITENDFNGDDPFIREIKKTGIEFIAA